MTEEQKAKLKDIEAEAWRKISSRASVFKIALDEKNVDRAFDHGIVLSNEIERNKKQISKFIDSCPE